MKSPIDLSKDKKTSNGGKSLKPNGAINGVGKNVRYPYDMYSMEVLAANQRQKTPSPFNT